MNFKNIDKKYRPVPFWSWNEKLETGPISFFKEPCVWHRNPEPEWNDNYCFVKMKI